MKLHQEADIIGGSIAGNLYAQADAVAQAAAQPADDIKVERLPFTVKVVHSEPDLAKAVRIRQSAYARHVPSVAEGLRTPEAGDFAEAAVVLLAESKLDGSPLGTMRIQTNRYRKLAIEQAMELPEWLQGKTLAEATRLGVVQERIGRVVRIALFKAFYLYCMEEEVDWMVIGGRSPIDKIYEALLFKDVFPGGGFVPLSYAGNIPHRIMALEPCMVETMWARHKQPLYDFFFRTRHADIKMSPQEVDTPVPAVSIAERRQMPWLGELAVSA